jgi:hypothetical protein
MLQGGRSGSAASTPPMTLFFLTYLVFSRQNTILGRQERGSLVTTTTNTTHPSPLPCPPIPNPNSPPKRDDQDDDPTAGTAEAASPEATRPTIRRTRRTKTNASPTKSERGNKMSDGTVNMSQVEALHVALQQSFSPNSGVRDPAEAMIKRLKFVPGATQMLLHITEEKQVRESARGRYRETEREGDRERTEVWLGRESHFFLFRYSPIPMRRDFIFHIHNVISVTNADGYESVHLKGPI